MRHLLRVLSIAALGAACLCADLGSVKGESNPEKRSRLALDNAEAAYRQAKKDLEDGNSEAAARDLKEVQESVELCQASLDATRQNPSKHPKNFKYAETRTRDLLRRMNDWERSLDATDRPLVEPVRTRIQEVHDLWLTGIFGKKR